MTVLYSFESGTVTGTTVINSGSDLPYDATLVNGASISWTDSGVGTSSVQLVATNSQYVQLPSYTFGSTGISFACWFRSDNSVDLSRVFDFSEGRDDGVFLDYVTMYIKGGYIGLWGLGAEQMTTVYVNDNVWRHVAWTIDMSGYWVLYVNGVDVWDLPGGYPISIVRTQNFLGHNFLGVNLNLNGAIDDFRVFDGVLRTSDVVDIYTKSYSSLIGVATSMTVLYSFDTANVVGTVVDNLGNKISYNGALSNGATISSSDFILGTSSVQLVAANSQFVQLQPYTFGSQGMSFACWFRSNNNVNWARVFEFGNGINSDNIAMFITGDGNLGVWPDGGTQFTALPIPVNDNVWRHVVWTIEASGHWQLYINGVSVYSDTSSSYPNIVRRTINNIGKSNFPADPYFNGAIDDFRVFNGVLGAWEVLNIYSLVTDPQFCPPGKLPTANIYKRSNS